MFLKVSKCLKSDYFNRDHLDKADQSDYRNITIHSRKLVVFHNLINNMDRNQPITTDRRDM